MKTVVAKTMRYSNIVQLILVVSLNKVIAENDDFLQSYSSDDFPSYADFEVYLLALERIINFSYDNREKLNLDFYFGLFLVNVNLQPWASVYFLPLQYRDRLNSMLHKNTRSLEFFNNKSLYGNINSEKEKKILTLLKNVTTWSRRMYSFRQIPSLMQDKWFGMHQGGYPDWNIYIQDVKNIDKFQPTPKQSDACIASLVHNEENLSNHPKKCRQNVTPYFCYELLLYGTNFGYGLAHRLLFLLAARFGRGCTVSSAARDRNMRRRFCDIMYNEAKYIAHNQFKDLDLILEQVTLCTLDGHYEFLHRSWIKNFLQHQTPNGCFSESLPANPQNEISRESAYYKISPDDPFEGEDGCSRHVTAVAAGTIAAALRYIIENIERTNAGFNYDEIEMKRK